MSCDKITVSYGSTLADEDKLFDKGDHNFFLSRQRVSLKPE